MGRLITGAGYSGTIGGNVTVYGTPERQTIVVADVAGTVTFDASFNKGGDTIVLAKSASAYTIAQSGSTVILSDGDTRVIIPVGTVANTVQFSDGDRSLLFSGGVKIGVQSVTTTATSITAAGTPKATLLADTATQAARLVLSEESVSIGGNVVIYGTAGSEKVSVVGNGKLTFDASFNKGGDTVIFSDPATSFNATKAGSSVTLTDGQMTAVLPVGTVGLDVNFAGDARVLRFAGGAFLLGQDTLAASGATILTGKPILSQTFEKVVSPSLDAKLVAWDWEALGVYDINGDGRKDIILANGGDGTLPGWQADQIPAKPSDLVTTVLFGNAKGELLQVNSSGIGVIGWVNDWIYLPKQDGSGLYIVGIDHGREVPILPEGYPDPQYQSKLVAIEYANGNFVRDDNAILGNYKRFWHNSWQIGDLNGDGLADFVVARMDGFGVLYGVKDSLARLSADFEYFAPSNAEIGGFGASAMLDIGGDGDLDFVVLPYSSDNNPTDVKGDIFKFQNGSPFVNQNQEFKYNLYIRYEQWANGLEPVEVTAFVNGTNSKFDNSITPMEAKTWVTGTLRISSNTPINNVELAVDNSFIKMTSATYTGPDKYEVIDVASAQRSKNLTADWAKPDWTLTGDSLIFKTSEPIQVTGGSYYFFQPSDLTLSHSTFVATLDGTPRNYGYVSTRVADVNGDGLDDIIAMLEARDGDNQRIIAVMTQNKSETFDVKYITEKSSFLLGPTNNEYSTDPKFELFDLDLDGNLDIIWNLYTGTAAYLPNTVLFGDGRGNFQFDAAKAAMIFKGITWAGEGRTMMDDFNGDGTVDLLVLLHDANTVTPIMFYNHVMFG